MVVVAKTSDPVVIRLTNKNKGVYAPEMRLFTCLPFALLVPISFFWYGWSAEKHTHWIVPIVGLLPFGIGGMVSSFLLTKSLTLCNSDIAPIGRIRSHPNILHRCSRSIRSLSNGRSHSKSLSICSFPALSSTSNVHQTWTWVGKQPAWFHSTGLDPRSRITLPLRRSDSGKIPDQSGR